MAELVEIEHAGIAGSAWVPADAFSTFWGPVEGWTLVGGGVVSYIPAPMRYRGTYGSGVMYAAGDQVDTASGSFIALRPVNGVAPASDATKWVPTVPPGVLAPLGAVTFAPSSGPTLDWSNNGAAATAHLTDGPAFSGPYLLGVGLSYDGHNGQKISVGNDNQIGIGISTEAPSVAYPVGAGPNSIGLLGSHFSSGKLVSLAKGSQNTGPLLELRADFGGTGHLLSWGRTAGREMGWINELGEMWFASDHASDQVSRLKAAGNAAGFTLRFYGRTGDPSLAFPAAIFTSGSTLNIGVSDSAAAPGAETDRVIIQLDAGNKLGFHGVAATTRQALAANATDLTTVIALANDIKAKLIAKGLNS